MCQKQTLININSLPIVEWCLHDRCNNKCSFCFHRTKLENVDVDKILLTLLPELYSRNYSNIQLEILGGELFSKLETENTYNYTKEMIEKLYKNNIYVKRVRIISNFIKTDFSGFYQLITYLKDNNIDYKISSSFDPIGRFNSENDLFNMINYYNKFIANFLKVSVVLHKSNIIYMLNHWKDKDDIKMNFIDTIHNNGHLSFDYYFPNYKVAVPESKLVSEFLIKAIQRFPKCSTITNIMDYNARHCSCNESIAVWNNKVVSCIKVSNVDDNRTLEQAIEDYQNKNGCLICKHYDKCSQICYGTSIGNEPDCFLKPVYDYLENINGKNN